MNYKRNKNGTFKSRSQWRKQQERKTLEGKYRLTMTLTSLVFALILGFAVQSDTYTIENTHVAQAFSPNLCELNYIDCGVKEESKVEKAIREIPHESVETENRIKYLYENAGDNADAMAHTIYCESMWNSIKSHLPEESYGIAQIHIPSHDVTIAQALDPYFSIDFMIANWSDDIWYGFDRDTDSCTNGLPEYWK